MDANVLFLKYEDMHRVSSWGYVLCPPNREELSTVLELSAVLGLLRPAPSGGKTERSTQFLPHPGMHVGLHPWSSTWPLLGQDGFQ